jgi:hypothetical protein
MKSQPQRKAHGKLGSKTGRKLIARSKYAALSEMDSAIEGGSNEAN